MKKLLLTLSVVAGLGGCKSTSGPAIQYEDVSIPTLSKESTAYLGEKMLMQARGYYANCVTVGGASGYQSTIKAGKFCQRDTRRNYFYSEDQQAVAAKGGFGEIVSYTNYVQYDAASNEVCASPLSCYNSTEMSISYTENEFVVQTNYLQQSIEYNGRSGSVLNFTYREFSGGLARDAFTTDFKMDLNEGNEIGYKGSRMTIHEATNNKITYTVTKNFN